MRWVWIVALLVVMPLATGQSKATKLKGDLKQVEAKKREVRQKLLAARQESARYSWEIKYTDQWLNKMAKAEAATARKLKEQQDEQVRLAKELEKAQAELEKRKALVQTRLRAMYVNKEQSMLSVVVGARDMGEIAARQGVMDRIMDADKQLFQETIALADKVEGMVREQETMVANIRALKARQQEEQARLAEAKAKKKEVLKQVNADKARLQAQFDEIDAESRRIENQLSAMYQTQLSSGVAVPFRGKFIRPVGGRTSSGYGMRRHPISGGRRMHTGIDWAVGTGTPIKAAASGTVVTSAYLRGYGNTVIIDHGGGFSTLYGHCSKLHVRAGQKVNQGQTIAAVGSTGNSTGPHLHFEIRKNGSPVNPASYL